VIAIGAAIGLLLSVVGARLLTTMLFGVQPFDAVTAGIVGVTLLVTTVIAMAGPAWRAVRVDPAVALRVN